VQLAPDGTLIVSATDLVGFLECDHLPTLELERANGLRKRPFREDPQLDLIRKRGYDHEQRVNERFRAEGRTVYEIAAREARTPEELRDAEGETLEAMRRGEDVIFQATFFDGRWRGHADYLIRRDDRTSDLGAWAYDVADTKLARRVKSAAIVQMCVYADLLERLQGVAPEIASVVTGDGQLHPHRIADFAAYFRFAKARFEARVFGEAPGPATYPEPVDHCRVCAWWSVCMDQRREDDHLSIVANITRRQRRDLVNAGIPTLAALADVGAGTSIRRIPPRIVDRLRRQAGLQLRKRETGVLEYELIPPDPDQPGKGLAALPEPSTLDVFFDIEADPWAVEDGLEYLLGYVELIDGQPAYRAIWAHDRAAEKAGFEAFIDMTMERLARDPGMHVYHYGGYESGALKRLMQRHATREDEVDLLLRGSVLVNLYDHVVRSGIRASVESYSIKQIEKFYMPMREGPVTDAGFSVVEYERWMESSDDVILAGIAAYNRDDCVSTLGLRDWLEELRVEAAPLFPDGVVPRPAPVDGAPTEELAAAQAETRARENALRHGLPVDRLLRDETQQGRWLLAALLDWHRREAKPAWWMWYFLRDAPMDDLVASSDALGELSFESVLEHRQRSVVERYRFDPAQETKIKEDDTPIDPATGDGAGTVVAINTLDGTIDLKRAGGRPQPRALIPAKPYGPEPMRTALGRVADAVISDGIDGPGRFRALRDLVLGRAPRLTLHPEGSPLARPGETALDAARRLAHALDDTVLPIQGPPGTGKTYTGARMIVELVRAGRRVGVTAQAHKAISNMLDAIAEAAVEAGVTVSMAQKCEQGDGPSTATGVDRINSNDRARAGLADGSFQVVGGTAWLWARDDMEASVDVLFVDEAGQQSLATAVAVGTAAHSIVLLGDPNQLPQVSQGTHPEGAAASALEHLVGESATIPPERGLLLTTTYRMHPDVNDYVSEVFYDGRLKPDAANARQGIDPGEPIGGEGIRFVPLTHAGSGNRSAVEAAWIAEAVAGLVGRTWTDRTGQRRALRVEDVLIVAPYNAQVAEIAQAVQRRLGVRGNVGTVDKFQGREAPVALYSMTTSSVEEAPRDFEFLYSGNRLNVAVSRARGLAAVVANPELLKAPCRTPEQMRLVSAICRYVEMAAESPDGEGTKPRGPLTLGLV
jgi:uncharacterized protein